MALMLLAMSMEHCSAPKMDSMRLVTHSAKVTDLTLLVQLKVAMMAASSLVCQKALQLLETLKEPRWLATHSAWMMVLTYSETNLAPDWDSVKVAWMEN